MSIKGLATYLLAVVLSVTVSWLIIQFVDGPIQKVRANIKARVHRPTNRELTGADVPRARGSVRY